MKKIFLYLLIQLFLLAALDTLNAQNLLMEDFSYTSGTNLGGQGGWIVTGGASPNHITIANGWLNYTGYGSSGIGNSTLLPNTNPGEMVLKNFTTQTSGSVYCSFMLRVNSIGATATQGFVAGFDQSGGTTNINTMLYISRSGASYQLGLRGKSDGALSYLPGNFSLNTVYLVVLKYKFLSGSNNDITSLFVFTSGVPGTEPVANASFSSGTDVPDNGQLVLNSDLIGTLTGSQVQIDGIRVGQSWQTTLLVGVEQTSAEVPTEFSLAQNYPNPFNPETNIKYQIAAFPGSSEGGKQDKLVVLKVFDITGREITTLVNQQQSAGTYRVNFSGNALCSGIYFYTLRAGDFIQTRKMVLIK